MQTPVRGLALPAEREEVDLPLFTLADSSETLSGLEIVGKMAKWSFSKPGEGLCMLLWLAVVLSRPMEGKGGSVYVSTSALLFKGFPWQRCGWTRV